jgi:hypothetical protein
MRTRSIFAWSAAPGLLSLIILSKGVREVTHSSANSKIEIGIPDSPGFRQLLAAIFVFTLGSSSDTFLLWRAREGVFQASTRLYCGLSSRW